MLDWFGSSSTEIRTVRAQRFFTRGCEFKFIRVFPLGGKAHYYFDGLRRVALSVDL
jgi:hypothetical protein